jgi:hypothetical protein
MVPNRSSNRMLRGGRIVDLSFEQPGEEDAPEEEEDEQS